jgi:hypothetical protein
MIIDSQDREVLYRALGVQRLLNLQDVMRLLRSEVDGREAKEHSREKPV